MSPRLYGLANLRRSRLLLAAALLSWLGAGAVRGDDRDLLRQASAEPYVFILLDTSGSMNWTPKSATCTTGDCFTPFQADDPGSKFYQAKQALYQVLTNPNFPALQLGFGTYNQDLLAVRAKHWLYEAVNAGPNLSGFGSFPAVGAQDVFGLDWACDNGVGSGDYIIGCTVNDPADLNDTWERARVQRLPKGGLIGGTTIPDFYVRSSNTTYKVRYTPVSGTYGSNLTVIVSILKCTNGNCNGAVTGSPATITFRPVTRSDGLSGADFFTWDFAADRNVPQLGYNANGLASDTLPPLPLVNIPTSPSCKGWDPNTDTSSGDTTNNYNLRFPTDTSDPRNASFDIGDVIPLDWKTDHKTDVLRRLAPNYPASPPDFRIATYLNNNRQAGESFLRLKDPAKRPLFANGYTPLVNSIKDFRAWYNGCSGSGTCAGNGGWVATAANPNSTIGDISFNCRQKYLLIITDGDETCSTGTAAAICAAASDLVTRMASEGVTTFVLAFGVENNTGNVLNCMGDADHVFYAQDQTELIDALEKTLGTISEDPRAFASAAVPSVQAEVADRIYLSSFRPIGDDASDPFVTPWVWDGHIDAYLKPLPLKNGKPDKARLCPAVGAPARSSCFLWDAGEVLKTQAPTRADLTSVALNEASLRLGTATNQRRVFYPKAPAGNAIPATLRFLVPPTGTPQTDPLWSDLWTGFKLPTPTSTTVSPTYNETKTRIETIIKNTMMIKQAKLQQTGLPDQNITYVLGDIFHAEPAIIDRPNDFLLYSGNAHGPIPPSANCNTSDKGYQCYAKKHSQRRKTLLVGADDGQLHAFDAGVWHIDLSLPAKGFFDEGTGKEIFSYIPRIGLPVVRSQTEGTRQIFGVDSTPRVDDVFIDPAHNGTPTPADREWRTVAVGGFREGGGVDGGSRISDFYSGYYALDITQPDKLDTNNNPINQDVVPTCLSTQNQVVSGCGPVPFPAVLWEFTDLQGASRLDEDLNGYSDLGQTWSVPTIGRIKVMEGGAEVEKNVAIFGGGMDADNKPNTKSGNWLYMVDIETGKTIYKRQLSGSATADPAVLDSDLDGILDTIYIGTTAGILYKVDIRSVPTLQTNVTISRLKAIPQLAADFQVTRITSTAWDPFPIFNTGGKPIYLPVTAFFAAHVGRFALAFGTGDREGLWEPTTEEGRFYLIVDDNFKASDIGPSGLPFDDADYQQVDIASSPAADGTSYVRSPGNGKKAGWYLTLPANERVITQTFGLSGVVIFSSFAPDDISPDRPCARGGASHIFVVYADNANAVMQTAGVPFRYRTVGAYVTNPFVEQGATKNPVTGGTNSEALDSIQKGIMETLKKFYPKGTKFANYWISVSGIRSDTGYERYATIPVGIIEWNWKEN